MEAIKDLIKSAMNKNATEFESSFDQAIAPKLDAALSAKYDEMFGKPAAEEIEDEDAEAVEEESHSDKHYGNN